MVVRSVGVTAASTNVRTLLRDMCRQLCEIAGCNYLSIPTVGHTFSEGRKEGNVLFNDALNTFYLRLYGVTHMVKDHSDSEREEIH